MPKNRRKEKRMLRKIKLTDDYVSTEQIRMIRTNIENTLSDYPTLLMVTSPNIEEQKSLISAKLAISFAEQKKRVLLVDANLRRPSLHRWFDIENKTGLANVIVHNEEVQLHARETFIPGLFLLPAGSPFVNPLEVWQSSKIKHAMSQWGWVYDVIIIEAPAFLSASHSQILADECNGVILVLRENDTKKEDTLLTKQFLERAEKRILGVIYQTG
ncbi:CpsD/CapB family tyrosine-protein kinase [Metabacillus fastidiosus]|uniref:CpsD/CapB family tyrosine-protein kinase n=1 Tax=Metabacillus fastidiosus TaxID=1458 RepID=UPI0008258D29|nr:CpsD/CapB family tyrosine-protein kinase [Metabacillus fastidiosus]MED4463031.1 CpsD/CapB family tyrosine-protein kinase [Metabacillus fastidiosus]